MDNKYAVYRKIRYDRTYRTLGRMSVWRVVLGVLLLISVLFISGFVSQLFAARGQFHVAQALMVSPKWMETYKPEMVDFFEAGVLYEDGDYAAAAEGFAALTEDVDGAAPMQTLSLLKLAQEKLAAGDAEGAYEAMTSGDPAELAPDYAEEYTEVCAQLRSRFASDPDRTAAIDALIEALPAEE